MRCLARAIPYISMTAAAMLCGATRATAQGAWVMPSAPALTYLGASPAKISQPSTPRDLAVAVADGVDSLGSAHNGVALDFAAWPLLTQFGYRVTGKAYQDSPLAFIWANTQVSAGSIRSAGDTNSTDIAFGLKTNLFNNGDPLHDKIASKGIDSVLDACFADPNNRTNGAPDPAKTGTCVSTKTQAFVQNWLSTNWNASALTIAAAFGSRLNQSDFRQYVGRGGALWTTLGLPVATYGQFLLQARGDWVRGGARSDTLGLSLGSRLSIGSETVNGFAELVGSWWKNNAAPTSQSWSGGIEFKAADKIWLSTGFGSAYNSLVKANRTVLIANVRWNVSDQSQLGK